jgi:hypothetical protein
MQLFRKPSDYSRLSLLYYYALNPFCERFVFWRAQRESAEKNSIYGPNGLMAKNQDRDQVIL